MHRSTVPRTEPSWSVVHEERKRTEFGEVRRTQWRHRQRPKMANSCRRRISSDPQWTLGSPLSHHWCRTSLDSSVCHFPPHSKSSTTWPFDFSTITDLGPVPSCLARVPFHVRSRGVSSPRRLHECGGMPYLVICFLGNCGWARVSSRRVILQVDLKGTLSTFHFSYIFLLRSLFHSITVIYLSFPAFSSLFGSHWRR